MADITGVISTVEDDEYQGKPHKKVTLQTGQVLKVKYGREGSLKEKWGMLIPGTAIKFVMRDYQGKPFVADIESVKDGLPTQKQAATVPTPDGHLVKAAQSIGAKVIPDANEIKNRSVAIAYAKDAWCAGKIEAKDITAYADRFLKYMKGE